MERLQNFIRVRRNDAETLDDDLVLDLVLSFPSIPDAPKPNRPSSASETAHGLLIFFFFSSKVRVPIRRKIRLE